MTIPVAALDSGIYINEWIVEVVAFVFLPIMRAALPVGAAILNGFELKFKKTTTADMIVVLPVPAAPLSIIKS